MSLVGREWFTTANTTPSALELVTLTAGTKCPTLSGPLCGIIASALGGTGGSPGERPWAHPSSDCGDEIQAALTVCELSVLQPPSSWLFYLHSGRTISGYKMEVFLPVNCFLTSLQRPHDTQIAFVSGKERCNVGTIWNLLKEEVGLFWKLPGRLGDMAGHDQDVGATLGSSKGSPPGNQEVFVMPRVLSQATPECEHPYTCCIHDGIFWCV